ncbi:MAG: protein-disulfide isomerase [Deltaproteobacteria bacterium]|nr:MAG: protein-disulfide isomerase [Deltaproteobacteria bacterium]
MNYKAFKILLFVSMLTLIASAAFAFGGCSEGECKDCHSLSIEQAQEAIEPLGVKSEVTDVRFSSVPGLWEVDVTDKKGGKIPVYLDFSLNYLIQGDIIEIATRQSLTRMRHAELNRINPSVIPLEDAVVLGDPEAKHRVIVFDDPECPFCKKMQAEMHKVVEERKDIAFFIKMLPLKIHPNARDKAKTIICEKSIELLDKSLAGEELPPPTCETDVIEKNEDLAAGLGIKSTPTIILPDGRIFPGAKRAEDIISFVDNPIDD